MAKSPVSAVLFAKDHRRVAEFYRGVFDASVEAQDDDHTQLHCAGFSLVIHKIPAEMAQSIVTAEPLLRREHGTIRLNLPVPDIAKSRRAAKQLGGQIDDRPPAWADGDTSFHLGHDPEGNVFGCNA